MRYDEEAQETQPTQRETDPSLLACGESLLGPAGKSAFVDVLTS